MTPRERLVALEQFGIKLGLHNISALVEGLGRPDQAWPSVHVAGTNGKGSVTAMIERAFRAAGYRTGRYTSPHLERIEERIAVDGTPVDSGLFDAATGDVLDTVDRLKRAGTLSALPTFFEVTTAVAFEIFRRQQISVGIVEVGLGGRFDATNVITPVASVITSIALDHERHLGSTLREIAFEKAGIIKPAVPVVVGDMPDEARCVIGERARAVGAPFVSAGSEHLEQARLVRGRATVDLHTPSGRYPSITLGLNGRHQIANALIAVRALEVCAPRGLPLTPGDIGRGLAEVDWPGRLEWLRMPDGRHVLVDAAHNPAGAAALAEYIAAAGLAPLPFVLAVMKDKDVDAIAASLAPVASSVVATTVASARALPAPDLAARVARVAPGLLVRSAESSDRALELALAGHGSACVAGSIFLAGPLRARLIAAGAIPACTPASTL